MAIYAITIDLQHRYFPDVRETVSVIRGRLADVARGGTFRAGTWEPAAYSQGDAESEGEAMAAKLVARHPRALARVSVRQIV